jgi:hypothetical protein
MRDEKWKMICEKWIDPAYRMNFFLPGKVSDRDALISIPSGEEKQDTSVSY